VRSGGAVNPPGTVRVAGWNLGKASVALVIGTLGPEGGLCVEKTRGAAHRGDPMALFRAWYAEEDVGTCAAIAATGAYAGALKPPVIVLPEDGCQQAALERDPSAPPTVNVVSIGGRGYSALARRPNDAPGGGSPFAYQFLESDKCSSGTGENILKLTGRFGLSIEEADALAGGAAESIPITARCSVFAKSEMTHYANEGRPKDALLRGYFTSVARNVRALLSRVEVDGPIYLVGGCARIHTLREVFAGLVEGPVHVPEHYTCFEAVGAAVLAAEQVRTAGGVRLPREGADLVRERSQRFKTLMPAHRYADRVVSMPTPAPHPHPYDEPAVLGLDLGSTGAKAVLTSAATGEVLLDLYDRTRGNPIDASQRLVRRLLEGGVPDVRAIGLTGSGRQAVATLLGGIWPEREPVVLNEIIAHATAAIRCDPEEGRDLSVIEIGGQDAKYIRISGGRIIESDMNKACSAGTGSFLEEQAIFYDVHDIGRFVDLATRAERPPELGRMCTVFVADAAGEALKDGFALGDIFAGFQYSVVQNYLNRVMGQRTLARTVFFQGKPASNPSLAWTLAGVTGRTIRVPPNPGAMGAWGIGLCAIDALGAERLARAPRLDLEAILRARIAERSVFACRDKRCRTLCPIERATVRIGEEERVALSGGACPKYEVATATRPKLPKDAPDPFRERDLLLAPSETEGAGDGPLVTVPHTGALLGYVPWARTLLRALGARVEVATSDARTLSRGEQLCNSYDSCGPAKIAHAVCDTDNRWLFFPKVMGLADANGVGGDSCITQQAMPDIVHASLVARGREVTVLRPRLDFTGGLETEAQLRVAREVARELGLPVDRAQYAVARAAAAQRTYERRLEETGRRALAWGRANDVPMVLVCGQLHVIHDGAINAALPALLRQNGALAIPVDCFPIEAATPAMEKVYWGDDKRSLRGAVAAREMGDVFPLMIASFGCGPSAISEQIFASVLEGYPHTILESDGHGGKAGFVTRIQAFLQSVQQFRAETDPVVADNAAAIAHTRPVPEGCRDLDRDTRYVFLTGPDYAGAVFAGTLRSFGYDAVAASPLSDEILEAGRRDCSGKECMPYQGIWGAFRHHLENDPPTGPTALVQVGANLCRAGVAPVKDRMSLAQMGLADRVSVIDLTATGTPEIDAKLWSGLVAIDLVRQLYLYHQAAAPSPEVAERTYRRYCAAVVRLAGTPSAGRFMGPARLGYQWLRLDRLLREASSEFARMGARDPGRPLRTVLVSGDIQTKGADFSTHGLLRHLAEHGVRMLWEPTCDNMEFLCYQLPSFVFGENAGDLEVAAFRWGMTSIRQHLYRVVRRDNPWIPTPDVRASIERTRELLDPATRGSASLAVGSVLRHWDEHPVDGVVMTCCWGCDDGLVEESLLRRRQDIPIYFYYDDGTPMDERRVRGFIHRLFREPPRRPAPPPTPRQEALPPPRLPLWHRAAERLLRAGVRP